MDPNDLRDCVEQEIKELIEPVAWERCEVVNKAEQGLRVAGKPDETRNARCTSCLFRWRSKCSRSRRLQSSATR